VFPFSTPFAMWSPLRVELVEQRLEGRFRLRWGDAIFSVIVLMVMSVVFGDQLVESLSSTSSRWRGSSFFPVLYLVMVFCIFLVPILSRSDDERLTAGLERLLASERPKELDCDTGA